MEKAAPPPDAQAEQLARQNIQAEVEGFMKTLPHRPGGREHLTAWMQANAGLLIDQYCPQCGSLLQVQFFPNGALVNCHCGLCNGSFKGL